MPAPISTSMALSIWWAFAWRWVMATLMFAMAVAIPLLFVEHALGWLLHVHPHLPPKAHRFMLGLLLLVVTPFAGVWTVRSLFKLRFDGHPMKLGHTV